jgi:hypothetical protein
VRRQPRFLRVSTPYISPCRLIPDTRSSHTARCFHRSCLDLYLDAAMRVRPLPSASTPMPMRSPPHYTAPGLTGQILKEAPRPPALRPLRRGSSCSTRTRWVASLDLGTHTHFHPLRVLYPIRVNCAAVLGRCVDMSPPLTAADSRRHPMYAAFWYHCEQSVPPHSFTDLSDANTEYTLSHDAGSPILPCTISLCAATSGSRPRDTISWRTRPLWQPTEYVIPSTPYPLHPHASCARCSASHGRDDTAPSWPRRR